MAEENFVAMSLKTRTHAWWKRRSTEFRKGLLIVVFLTAVAVVMVTTSVIESHFHSDGIVISSGVGDEIQLETNICYTKGCNQSANRLLSFMNKEMDPCDDFYEFVCGRYVKNTVIPDDKASTSMFSDVTDTVIEQLRTLVEESPLENELEPFKSMKYLYKACMDEEQVEKLDLQPVKHLLSKIGGWPLLEGDKWDESNFSWTEMVYTFRKHGLSADYFIDLSVLPDFKNTTLRRVQIGEPSLTMKREYFIKGLNDTIISAYYKYMVDIAVMFGADKQRAEKEQKETLLFEMALANITTPVEEHRDNLGKFHNPMKVQEAQQKYPFMDWLEYINSILAPIEKIEDTEIIVINSPKYLGNFSQIINNTSKRIQANYMMWRATQSAISYLSKAVRDRQQEFSSILYGKTARMPRWKECVNLACGSFHVASGSMYVDKYFKEDSKKEVLELVTNLREEMYNILKSVEWMDDTTRKSALDKAYAIENHVAYPDELLNREKVAKVYENLTVIPGDYYDMILNITRFGSDYSFAKLREPVNKTDWKSHSHADTVNAMYNPLQNSIEFPAGILQSVFFSKDRPRYMNYGAIGFVMGHEITHAFDDQGRQFDKNGNLRDWWDPDTEKRYREKANCVVNQYNNYTIEEIAVKLNGYNSQGENIADNGGLRESYNAYNNWLKKRGIPEPQLPGLPYTPQQMFWISFANVWCSKSRPEMLRYQVDTAVHAPSKIRIIGAVSNQEEFSADFNCPLGSRMNPIKKCKVW